MSDQVATAVRAFGQALARRDRAAVNAAAAALIALHAPLGSQWQSIAAALRWNGEVNLALSALNEMSAAAPAAAGYARANLLYASGRIEEALVELDALVESGFGPKTGEHRLSHASFRASILLLTGDQRQARENVLEALELDPRSGQAWLTFTEFADFRDSDSSFAEKLETAFTLGASNPVEGAKLAHALGRMRHQIGNHEGAFTAFADGARLFQPHAGDKSGQAPADILDRVTSWTRPFIQEVSSRVTVPHDRVLFVSGLPRSGTTLVEQILASHPDVDTGEEFGFFRVLAQDIGGVDEASFRAWLARGGDPNQLVELYLHLATERVGPEARFIDKTVEAGNYMGLLLALFPNAPIFWLRREPVDNGWSAFRTYFARGAGWSWDLERIGARLGREDLMIDHWRREAPDRITFVDYEALVRDPELHIREIAKGAGLTATEQMFRPHETRRTVATASVNQVREPINLKGLGVAGPYRPWLGPMIESYERSSVSARSSDGG